MRFGLFALSVALFVNGVTCKGGRATKFAAYHSVPITGDREADYAAYMQTHYSSYTPDQNHAERRARWDVCHQQAVSQDADQNGYAVGLTPMCHWTKSEYEQMLNPTAGAGSANAQNDLAAIAETRKRRQTLPTSVNWTAAGAVTSVKNQLYCGSCYTFAAAAALESAFYLKYKQLNDLSTQQYLDCSANYSANTIVTSSGGSCNIVQVAGKYTIQCGTPSMVSSQQWSVSTSGNSQCGGGTFQACWAYNNMTASTQNTWTCYPYTSGNGANGKSCLYNSSCNIGVKVHGYVQVAANESSLMAAVAQQPVACAIDASTISNYVGGIFTGGGCSSTSTNHAITVVGYGTTNGTAYWLIKNSWGGWGQWGQGGYMQLLRGSGTCGIATSCAYPVVN